MNRHRGGTSEAVAWIKRTRFVVKGVKPSTAKGIMMILGDYLDERWSCWLGQDAIAEMADVTERTVREFLVAAEQEGFLCRIRRTQKEAVGKGRGRGTDRLYLHVDDDRSGCPQCLGLPEETSGESEGAESSLTGSLEPGLPEAWSQNAQGTPLIPEPASEPASGGEDQDPLFAASGSVNGRGRKPKKDPDPDGEIERSFGLFWEQYPRGNDGRRGDKAATRKFWFKMGLEDRRGAYRATKSYAAKCAETNRLVRAAERFLKDDHWRSWIEADEGQPFDKHAGLYDAR